MLFLFATVAGAGALAWIAPAAAVQPGRVQAAHAEFANDCLVCHEVFAGARGAKCAVCHHAENIGLRSAAGLELAAPKPALQRLHAGALFAGTDCIACHSEHAGRLGEGKATRFAHVQLPDDLRANCVACHADRVPPDDLHRAASDACTGCHETAGWKPASIDHGLLLVARSEDCGSCHAAVQPQDEIHLGSGDACSICHSTSAWKPSTFDHARYFRFDQDHPARCADCHEAGEPLHAYTCYGCHEHTPARVASEHREEGIRDFANCVECHRGADKEGAERRGEGRHEHGREGDGDDD